MIPNEGKRIGITTTVPLEPFLAADTVAVDLNNAFISSHDPGIMVEDSQVKGYPRNICTWIKGLHIASSDMDGVVGVVRGDCSNTESLLETLEREGMAVHPFSYPFNRRRDELETQISSLCSFLGTDMDEAKEWALYVRELRDIALKVDEIGWKEGSILPNDVHLTLVSTSDFDTDPEKWREGVQSLIDGSRKRSPPTEGPRLGYIGVPPIISDIFPVIDSLGAEVVFFETQRQFAMPSREGDWIDQYLDYTYPYEIQARIDDIKERIKERRIDGIIHYVQSFCHRQIDDVIFRKELDIPIMTLEGNLPGPMDGRNLIRLEAFLDVLEGEP